VTCSFSVPSPTQCDIFPGKAGLTPQGLQGMTCQVCRTGGNCQPALLSSNCRKKRMLTIRRRAQNPESMEDLIGHLLKIDFHLQEIILLKTLNPKCFSKKNPTHFQILLCQFIRR